MIDSSKIEFCTKKTDFVKIYSAKLNIESTITLSNSVSSTDTEFKDRIRKKLTAGIYSEIYSVTDTELLARCIPSLLQYCEYLKTESVTGNQRDSISCEQSLIESLLIEINTRLSVSSVKQKRRIIK
jgi:hypothetical protein